MAENAIKKNRVWIHFKKLKGTINRLVWAVRKQLRVKFFLPICRRTFSLRKNPQQVVQPTLETLIQCYQFLDFNQTQREINQMTHVLGCVLTS